jgi:hypothetical protein
MALYLLKESLTNSIRFSATFFNINFTYNALLNAWKVETYDDGTGEADFDRMNGPAGKDGDDTARYGHGDWARQFFGDPDVADPNGGGLPARRVAKVAGSEYAVSVVTGPLPEFWEPKQVYYLDKKQSPFDPTVDSHGFYYMNHIAASEMSGVTADNLLATFREIVTVGFDQSTLDAIHINVSINGKHVADSREEKNEWKSFETALMEQSGTLVNDDGFADEIADHVKISVHKMRHMLGQIPDFPNYGARTNDTSLAFMFQGGILIEERKIHETFGYAVNASNQQGCLAFIDFSLADPNMPVKRLATPAATKTAFMAQCPVYLACREKLAKIRDNRWICYPARKPSIEVETPEQLRAQAAAKKQAKKQAKKAAVVVPPVVAEPPRAPVVVPKKAVRKPAKPVAAKVILPGPVVVEQRVVLPMVEPVAVVEPLADVDAIVARLRIGCSNLAFLTAALALLTEYQIV